MLLRCLLVVFVCVGAWSCGGSAAVTCADNSAMEGCGDTCDVNNPCPAGLFCGADGTCSAECTSASQCSDGQLCNSNGQCVSAADAPDCPNVMVTLEPQTPTVVLLIDRSGSMTESFNDPQGNPSNRWDEVHRALTDPTDGVLLALQDKVVFGASLYDSDDGYGPDPQNPRVCPRLITVSAALNTASAIDTLMDDNDPDDDTPTAESLTATYNNFPDPVTPTSPRVVILATDGDPDTCEDPDSNGQLASKTLSENAVVAGKALGIDTFILSVGNAATLSHLRRMARAGVGQDLDTGTAEPYVATEAGGLIAAFNQIILGTRSCTLALDGQVSDGSQGVVTLNGQALVYSVDWQLVGSSSIELLGTACNTFLNTSEVDLNAEFPCGVVIDID